MADMFRVRGWLKVSSSLLAAFSLLSGFLTWHFWKQLEFEIDESRFLMAAAVTGALLVGTVVVFLFYLASLWTTTPGRSFSDRFDEMPWWTLAVVVIALLIGASGFFIHNYQDEAESEFELLREGRLEILQDRLRDRPALLARTDRQGLSLVQAAYRQGNADAVRLLLEMGCPAENLAPEGRSPVIESLRSLAMLEVLLANGLNPSVNDAEGTPAVYLAAQLRLDEAVNLLVKFGADVDARSRIARTALMACIESGQLEGAAQLLDMGASVNAFDQRGDTALHLAVRRRSLEGVRLLLEAGADPAVFNFIHMTPLHLAAEGGYAELIEPLAGYTDSADLSDAAGHTPFDLALAHRQYEAAEVLLACGADLNRAEADGVTLLHHAVDSRDYTAARFLIRAGADAHRADRAGRTVLGICREKGLQGLVELIETAGREEE